MPSTNDELEAIEWAARGGAPAAKPHGQRGGPRRGSSLFAPIGGLGFGGGGGSDRAAPSKPASAGDDLLVDFPGSDDERVYDDDDDEDYVAPTAHNGMGSSGGPSFQQANPSAGIPPQVNPISVAASMPSGMSGMQGGAPMGGGGGGGGPRRDSVVMQPIAMAALGGLGDYSDSEDDEPNVGGAVPPMPDVPGQGDPNHRPMVGGFAAAAYEAARAYHYQHQGKARGGGAAGAMRKGPPPPSI